MVNIKCQKVNIDFGSQHPWHLVLSVLILRSKSNTRQTPRGKGKCELNPLLTGFSIPSFMGLNEPKKRGSPIQASDQKRAISQFATSELLLQSYMRI